jgi:predicted Zn-dependent protease
VISGQGANGQRLSDFYQQACKEGMACEYGKAMQSISLNQFNQAEARLQSLLDKNPNNLFFQLAMADAEVGNKQYDKAKNRLIGLKTSMPDNYAILRAYAHVLLISGQPEQAISVLLKAQRQFNKDLPICEELAKAQSEAGRKAYAYFTESQCQLLQGRTREAMRQLKMVTKLAKKDAYILARANAMIEEIKFMRDD